MSNHGFDSQVRQVFFFFFTYQVPVCTYEYEIRHTILHIKMAGWLFAGGRPNVAIEYGVARCRLRYHALVFTESLPLFHASQTNTLALSRMQKKSKKKHHRVFRACIRLLCTWHRIECTVYLFATQRLSPRYTLELSGSPGPASLHTRLSRRAQINQSQRHSGIRYYYILFAMTNNKSINKITTYKK